MSTWTILMRTRRDGTRSSRACLRDPSALHRNPNAADEVLKPWVGAHRCPLLSNGEQMHQGAALLVSLLQEREYLLGPAEHVFAMHAWAGSEDLARAELPHVLPLLAQANRENALGQWVAAT